MKSLIKITALILWSIHFTSSGQTAKWETIIPDGSHPTPRHENGFVETNGKFYLLGGRGIKPVDIFDPGTKRWIEGAPSPIELHHFQAVMYKTKFSSLVP